MVKYNNAFESLTANGVVPSNCNEIIFIRHGSGLVTINGFPLRFDGDFWANDGNQNELDTTTYNVQITGGSVCWIMRKYYQ